jgi:hypothetical protein
MNSVSGGAPLRAKSPGSLRDFSPVTRRSSVPRIHCSCALLAVARLGYNGALDSLVVSRVHWSRSVVIPSARFELIIFIDSAWLGIAPSGDSVSECEPESSRRRTKQHDEVENRIRVRHGSHGVVRFSVPLDRTLAGVAATEKLILRSETTGNS